MSPLYELSNTAEDDWDGIVRYTLENFGKRQVRKYTDRLLGCLDMLAKNEGAYKEMNISTHKVLVKKCQKHYVFALTRKNRPLLILAIFHEKMDLMQRLKNRL